MQLIDIELAFEALINSLSFKTILFGSAFALFLLWSRSDILPALNHITMSIGTTEFQELPRDVKAELSATIVPFGKTMSRLFIMTILFLTINRMCETLLEDSAVIPVAFSPSPATFIPSRSKRPRAFKP